MNKNNWLIEGRLLVRHLSGAGLIGLVLLCTALVVGLAFVRPVLQETRQIKKTYSRWQLEQNQMPKTSLVLSQTLSLDEKARAHIADLPTLQEVSEIITRLHEVARASGVTWLQADFLFSPASATQLPTYSLVFPLQGSYKNIRQFITNSLNNEPALALSEISFKREDPNAAQVNAQVRFVLYLKPESGQ